ncbi:MAG: FAD-dependent oxidoreductase [Gammaproteobacteria bacterium]|nr:FAD-dependent oxidoreductase [Gammaproteobacteria bacterium]
MNPNWRFRKLFEPGHMGELELRNRIVMAPMGTNFAAEDGHVTQRLTAYYEERARGGVGLIIVGVGSVDHPRGNIIPRQVALSDDKFIPGLRRLVRAVNKHGAKIAIQLNHGGKLSRQDLAEGYAPVTPSPASTLMTEMLEGLTKDEIRRLAMQFAKMPSDKTTRELTVDEIKRIVRRFAESAERAKVAGFDGVEVHAGHGYLIAEFLSRSSNRRQDAYGGQFENRARLLMEIISAVRAKVGDSYPVWCRIDGKEFNIEGGITVDEAQWLACMLEDAGIDGLHVSGYGGVGLGGFYDAPIVYPPGNLVPFAHGIKKVVSIPVIAVGRISPELAEEVLREGKADFVAMGRPLLADPRLPNKLALGEADRIRPCIQCYCCVSQIFWGESVYCTVNPATGNESQFPANPARVHKRVLVVGGGPAGIEAAAAAASRGHRVTLCERENHLGGQLHLASLPPFKQEIREYIRFAAAELKATDVDMQLGREATATDLAEAGPDVVVIATGGRPLVPDIPGIRGNAVATAHDVISGRTATGHRILIAGGGLIGCEVADLLASCGKQVTLVEMLPNVAVDEVVWLRLLLRKRLEQGGVTILTSATVVEITNDGAILEREGQRQTISCMDTIVLALGIEPSDEISQDLTDRVPDVLVVGDARSPSKARDAIATGAEVGNQI